MSNIDTKEVQKFSQLANRWWDKEGDLKSLHDINPLRLEFINSHSPLKGKKVLDLGCGGGILAESMAAFGAEVTGVDMSAEALDVAKLHLHESGLKVDYHQSTAEEFAKQHPEHFDIVTCMEMLEHVPEPDSIVKSCAQLVKSEGAVFFSTLNRNPKAYVHAILGAEYLLKLLPKGTHDYAKFIKPSELARWGRACDLQLQIQKGMGYNPLTKNYYINDNINVNYLAYYQKESSE